MKLSIPNPCLFGVLALESEPIDLRLCPNLLERQFRPPCARDPVHSIFRFYVAIARVEFAAAWPPPLTPRRDKTASCISLLRN
jgi:hypothetical protein